MSLLILLYINMYQFLKFSFFENSVLVVSVRILLQVKKQIKCATKNNWKQLRSISYVYIGFSL